MVVGAVRIKSIISNRPARLLSGNSKIHPRCNVGRSPNIIVSDRGVLGAYCAPSGPYTGAVPVMAVIILEARATNSGVTFELWHKNTEKRTQHQTNGSIWYLGRGWSCSGISCRLAQQSSSPRISVQRNISELFHMWKACTCITTAEIICRRLRGTSTKKNSGKTSSLDSQSIHQSIHVDILELR